MLEIIAEYLLTSQHNLSQIGQEYFLTLLAANREYAVSCALLQSTHLPQEVYDKLQTQPVALREQLPDAVYERLSQYHNALKEQHEMYLIARQLRKEPEAFRGQMPSQVKRD